MKKFINLLLFIILHNYIFCQVTVKNNTNKTVRIAIGWIESKETNSNYYSRSKSRGWWSIKAGDEKTIISTCPSKNQIFFYAESIDGKIIWCGSKDQYGKGSIPDYFRAPNENFEMYNPEFDSQATYEKGYWKIFRRTNVTKYSIFDNYKAYITINE